MVERSRRLLSLVDSLITLHHAYLPEIGAVEAGAPSYILI